MCPLYIIPDSQSWEPSIVLYILEYLSTNYAMAAPPPPVLPAGIAPLLTHMGDPSANGGANPGPLYVLIREDVVFINSHAVCIPVDAAAAIHTEARPNRRPHWRNRSGGDTGLMAAFIATAYPNGILVGNAVEAPGDINSGSYWV